MSDAIREQIAAPKSGDVPDQQSFVEDGFLRILGRRPSEGELRVCMEYLANSDDAARASLVRILLNHHDFVTIR